MIDNRGNDIGFPDDFPESLRRGLEEHTASMVRIELEGSIEDNEYRIARHYEVHGEAWTEIRETYESAITEARAGLLSLDRAGIQ